MTKYAFIKHGTVENIGLIDSSSPQGAAFLAEQQLRWDAVEPVDDHLGVSVGWLFNAETSAFSAPALAAAETVTAGRHISVGAFFDRFGGHKWTILADPHPGIQALIKDCSVRKHIDLDREDLPMGLATIISAGYAIDQDTVLNAPIQAKELP